MTSHRQVFKSYPRENVEEEWFDVVVKCFVVEKELDQETKVLTVNLVCVAIHLKDGEVILVEDEKNLLEF